MRCGCITLAAALALIVWGGQGLYEAVVHGKQKTVTYQQFVKECSKGGWFKITNCVEVIPEAAFKKSVGTIDEAYVPIYGDDEKEEKETFLVLKTEDKAVLEQIEALEALGDDAKEEVVLAHLEKNKDKLILRKELEGMVQFGVSSDSKTRDKISGLNKALASDFVILEHGAKPSMLRSIGMLVGGLVLLVVMLFVWVGNSKE